MPYMYINSCLCVYRLPLDQESSVMEEEDECPELVPIKEKETGPTVQIPVTIITGYLG